VTEIFREYREARPDEAALTDERGTTTWADFDLRTNQLIHGLRAAGLKVGSTLGVLAGNRREYYEALAACAHAGMLLVPINWHFHEEEVEYVLENSDAEGFLVGHRFVELAAKASEKLQSLKLKLVIEGDDDAPLPDASWAGYESWLASQPEEEPEDQGLGGVMFYTSGTTGRPKGVRSSGRAQLGGPMDTQKFVYKGFSGMLGAPGQGTTLLTGPLYHSAQWAFSMFPLGAGSAVVMRHRFDPAETLELIDRYSVTNVHLVPTQFIRLLKLEDATRESFDGSSLVKVWHGAAPCSPDVKRRMIDWFGPIITEYYGGTEGAIVSLIDADEWLERPTSVGKPVATVDVLVVSEQGEPCAAGESGQLYLKSKIGMDFEYHKEPEKTKGAHLEPGVFTLGDIGHLDEDGYLHLSDRKIDMIISGGVNIYPAEIEGVLAGHPAVKDVAVFGVPDEEFGEQVKAAVELMEGHTSSDALAGELMGYCREHLAGYKTPRSVDFEESLPRHPTGKLYKRLLRDPYWEGHARRI
jgi:long-chain acyl-CoA synthetase